MYYVNREQIELRIQYMLSIIETAEKLNTSFDSNDLMQVLAQERLLHIAIEYVTDVGSYLIDGFIMRDASSYEDIVEIMRDEKVITEPLFISLLELVKLRKPLVQQYYELNTSMLNPYLNQLPVMLSEFTNSVNQYLDKELN